MGSGSGLGGSWAPSIGSGANSAIASTSIAAAASSPMIGCGSASTRIGLGGVRLPGGLRSFLDGHLVLGGADGLQSMLCRHHRFCDGLRHDLGDFVGLDDRDRLSGWKLARQCGVGMLGRPVGRLVAQCGEGGRGLLAAREIGRARILRAGQGLGEVVRGAMLTTSPPAGRRGLRLRCDPDSVLGRDRLDRRPGAGWRAFQPAEGAGCAVADPDIGSRRSKRASRRSTRERSEATSPRDSPSASSAWP